MARIYIYTSHDYLGECGVNLNTKCGCHFIIVIKHGLLCFVMLMHGWACIDYGPQLVLWQCMPTHALTFTKHRQSMFNYYNIWCHDNNIVMSCIPMVTITSIFQQKRPNFSLKTSYIYYRFAMEIRHQSL